MTRTEPDLKMDPYRVADETFVVPWLPWIEALMVGFGADFSRGATAIPPSPNPSCTKPRRADMRSARRHR